MRGRDTVRALSLVPLLFAVPVMVGILRSALDLLGVAHPFYGDISGTEVDAVAVYLGHTPYHDPATGFSGLVYTPLLVFLWGGLNHLRLWGGWGLLLVLIADLSLIALVARTAYRPRGVDRGERLVSALGAAGIGAFAFWLVTCVPFSFTFEARVDQPAWAATFAGLLLMPRVATGSRRLTVATIVLLTLGNWFKQAVLPADIAAVAWLGCEAIAGRVTWRLVAIFGATLAALNALPVVVAGLLTDGWFWRFVVTMPAARPAATSTFHAITALLESSAPALVMTAAIWLSLAAVRRARSARTGSGDRGLALLVLLFIAIELVPAVAFRRAIQTEDNQFIGIVWALGFLIAIGWARARERAVICLVAAGAVAVAFVGGQTDGLRQRVQNDLSVTLRPVGLRAPVAELSPALVRYARHHRVYDPPLSWVSVLGDRRVYPNHAEVAQLLTSDYQPRYLVNALLSRRFDAVFLFDDSAAEERTAGTGYFEDNYLWKLNEVVRANYAPAPRALASLRAAGYLRMFFAYRSPALYVRKPGPPRAPWMRHCFAPFDIGHARWKIRRGGGFWCRPGGRGTTLRLVRTRAAWSELRTAGRAAGLSGELGVGLPRARGALRVKAGDYALLAQRLPASVRLDLVARGRVVAATRVPGTRVALRFKRGPAGIRGHARRVEVAIPAIRNTRVSLWATSGSDATFDLGNFRLGT